MPSDYTLEFFKSLHDDEFARKESHETADSALAAGLTVLGGVGYFYLQLVTESELSGALPNFFVSFAILFGVAFFWSVYFLIRSMWPRNIGYTSGPKDLHNYLVGLQAHYGYDNTQQSEIDSAVDLELRTLSLRQYVNCAAVNRDYNFAKLKFQSNAKRGMVAAVVLMALNLWPTFWLQSHRSQSQIIEVIKMPGVNVQMTSQERDPTE